MISYYSHSENLFVFAGKEPLRDDIVIQNEDIDLNQRLIIRCKPNTHSSMSPQNSDLKKEKPPISQTNSAFQSKTSNAGNDP